MSESFLNARVTIHVGDVKAKLRELPSDHFDCVVTSPPYWGLRDYGVTGQIGLERTLGEHLEVMVDVFEGVRRVLKPTGTLWLNYGDCYATQPNGRSAAATKAAGNGGGNNPAVAIYDPDHRPSGSNRTRGRNSGSKQTKDDAALPPAGRIVSGTVLKPKDLCMIPNRLAIALQAAGWWVRSEIIWHKPNPMPESIKDRPACAHEKVWLLSKSERYYYDHIAVRQPLAAASYARLDQDIESQEGGDRANGGAKTNGKMKAVKFGGNKGQGEHGSAARRASGNDWNPLSETANLKNVWTIATAAFSEAHFATFPPALVERCVKAGCPIDGEVLDIFGGAGTTGMVAASLGRRATLIELNPEYATLARARIEAAFMGKEEGARHMAKQLAKDKAPFEPGSLFAGLEAAE